MECRLNAFVSSANNYKEHIFLLLGYFNEASKPYSAENNLSMVKRTQKT